MDSSWTLLNFHYVQLCFKVNKIHKLNTYGTAWERSKKYLLWPARTMPPSFFNFFVTTKVLDTLHRKLTLSEKKENSFSSWFVHMLETLKRWATIQNSDRTIVGQSCVFQGPNWRSVSGGGVRLRIMSADWLLELMIFVIIGFDDVLSSFWLGLFQPIRRREIRKLRPGPTFRWGFQISSPLIGRSL